MDPRAAEPTGDRTSGPRLLERDAELARLRDALGAARDGAGRVVLVPGPPGIGKTSLLRATRRLARDRGMTVLSARGRELEREFPLGVARQLYEPELRGATPARRAALLEGAAGLAGPFLSSGPPAAGAGDGGGHGDVSFGLVHGLHWLTANLADERPLLVLADDLHWADEASVRFLIYLGSRIADLPALLVLAIRSGESDDRETLLAALDAEPTTVRLTPAALSEAAVGELVSAELGPEADPTFSAACARATGGNPFLLGELLGELRDEHVAPLAGAVTHVDRVRPASVARTVLLRLMRLGPEAQRLAEAVALLEKGTLHDAATLAGLTREAARTAADRLFVTHILTAPPALSFVHPLMRRAVYEGIAPAARADGHRRAALLLGGVGVGVGERGADSLAGHLLRGEPAGDPVIVALCRRAADEALARGDPASGARLLARALAEPVAAGQRGAVLGALGEAQALARDPAAEDHLRAALACDLDPAQRVRLAAVLIQWLLWNGAIDDAHALVGDELERLGGDGLVGLRVALETLRTGVASVSRELITSVETRLDELHELALSAGPAGASLLIAEGCVRAQRGPWTGPWRELLDTGLRDVPGAAGSPMSDYAAVCFVFGDELTRARALLAAMHEDAVARGSIRAYLNTVTWRSVLALRAGRLAEVEEGARTALTLATRHEILWTVLWATAALVQMLVEAGRLAEAESVLDAAPLHAARGSSPWLHATLARARLFNALGRPEQGAADARVAGELTIIDNPSYVPWRSVLVQALGPGPEARALAAAELARARELEQPRGIARALRACAAAGGVEWSSALEQAASLLRELGARVELAATLCDLGAARRRAGERVAAREPLREAAELARECGAVPLRERAVAELEASGARPRRTRFAGPDALTPSERRVAELAASGLTNRAIAQALFVTTKTVSTHLGHIYAKLGLHGPDARDQLAPWLAADPER